MRRYVRFTGCNASKLIGQARRDYLDHAPPWELKALKSFEDFAKELKKQGLANMTMLAYLNGIKNFYNFHKVPLPKTDVNISATLTERYREVELLKLEDVRKFVDACGVDQRLLKALVLTFLSSGQAQAEIQTLKGKHLRNGSSNNVAKVRMTRGKTNIDYVFFIGKEALDAIHEYKPVLGDEEYVFTQEDGRTKLYNVYIDMLFRRHAEKLDFDPKYINPHRFRHYFKTVLTGNMDTNFIEFLMGHKLKGVEASYFKGTSIQQKILDAYVKNLPLLSVYTDKEVLQKQYDDLKKRHGSENEALKREVDNMKEAYQEMKNHREQERLQFEKMERVYESIMSVLPKEFREKVGGVANASR